MVENLIYYISISSVIVRQFVTLSGRFQASLHFYGNLQQRKKKIYWRCIPTIALWFLNEKNNSNANTDCDENLEPEQHLGLLMLTLHDIPEPEKYS